MHDPDMTDELFAITKARYNDAHAAGKKLVSNFPYHELQSMPGYKERDTPSLSATGVAEEISHHLITYAARNDCPIPYTARDVSHYFYLQASLGSIEWEDIFRVVRATTKRDPEQRISHHFGYREFIRPKGKARKGKAAKDDLISLVCYIKQQGICSGCQKEFPYKKLTWDHTKPRARGGSDHPSNATVMCKPCNHAKADHYPE